MMRFLLITAFSIASVANASNLGSKGVAESGEEQEQAFFKSRVCTTASVLVEVDSKGHTDHFAPIRFGTEIPESLNSTIVQAKITGYDSKGLIGSLLS